MQAEAAGCRGASPLTPAPPRTPHLRCPCFWAGPWAGSVHLPSLVSEPPAKPSAEGSVCTSRTPPPPSRGGPRPPSQSAHEAASPTTGTALPDACFWNTSREQDPGLPGRAPRHQLHPSSLCCLHASSNPQHLLPHSPTKHPCSPLFPPPSLLLCRVPALHTHPCLSPAPAALLPAAAGEPCKTPLEMATLLCSGFYPPPDHPLPSRQMLQSLLSQA